MHENHMQNMVNVRINPPPPLQKKKKKEEKYITFVRGGYFKLRFSEM